jgi:mannan endo-1,6-alpha-mannosidase
MFGTLIDYWHYTGDDSYNDLVMQGMVHQVGDTRDYMPGNQTSSMGNDDQGFWAMASMTAAENLFPDPPEEDDPQWVALVQGVFNEYTRRWDTENCDGGLRWQVFNIHQGYRYKNSISNGCLFNIAARLARYTANDTYAEWAEKVWDWEVDTGLITSDFKVYDGVTLQEGQPCNSDMDKAEWSYNAGIFLHGAATLWNYTEDQIWRDRVEGILTYSLEKFTKDGVIFEGNCEPIDDCNNDERSFKAYYLRGLAAVALYIPELYDTVIPTIRNSAEAAAGVCTGSGTQNAPGLPPFRGHPNTACGQKWTTNGEFDGDMGIGEQLAALSALTYTLVADTTGPITNDTGGTSRGDPGAGGPDEDKLNVLRPVTTGDRVGAGFLTTLLLAGIIGGTAFVVMEGKTIGAVPPPA